MALGTWLAAVSAGAQICNLRVVTDASPDYTDLDSLVYSATSRWKTDAEKCWALFYWNHIGRRQTQPMELHGKAETDPIRQFNDYGYTMCSTISGINCAIWQHMGYPVRYYDIALHTVPEVFYDGRWHHYDNSLSVIYTLCDGRTIAGVEDIGKTLGCAASGGREEPGHIAIYHALNGTGPDGFLEGADTPRDLRHIGRDCFAPSALKYRYYFNDAERGHRCILNLREGETYSRFYRRLDPAGTGEKQSSDPAYFVANGANKDGTPRDPEAANYRYRIRGNGVRTFEPELTEDGLAGALHVGRNLRALNPGLEPAGAGDAEAVFKIEGANVIASTRITADLFTRGEADEATLSVSADNGMTWKDVCRAGTQGLNKVDLRLVDEVNGAYEALVRLLLRPRGQPSDAQLRNIRFDTITQVNGKTLPRLNLGRNTVYVGAGEQTQAIVLWPDLQGDRSRPWIVEKRNIRTREKHEGWNAVMNPDESGEGHVVFRIDVPQDLCGIVQEARMYVREPGAAIDFEHSFDGGRTWTRSYSFADTHPPWDDYHREVTTHVPPGARSAWFKYRLRKAGLYSVRMEARHQPADARMDPLDVCFSWQERQEDYSLVGRTHTRRIERLPATYTLDVGGADHPVMEALSISRNGPPDSRMRGDTDARIAGATKWVGRWVTCGTNFAQGRPYAVSVPPVPAEQSWGAGDPDGRKLTDGRVGSSYSGGTSYREGALWDKGNGPDITVDLGESRRLGAFRVHVHGYPAQDAIRGQVRDGVEVLVSGDGRDYRSVGRFDFRLRWKDIPVNFMWTDEETFAAHNHTLVLDQPVEARYVRYRVTPSRRMAITEVQALDDVKSEPFDLRIVLPTAM